MARLTFAQMIIDHRVDDYSDERYPGGCYNEGIWLYLAPGWVTGEGLLTIHEMTIRECSSELQATRYSPDEWIQSLQGSQALKLPQEALLPGN